jgi:hypothetical protein
LVKQEAVAPAVAILHGLGYRARSPRFPLDQKTLSILQRVRADIEFRHAIHGHVVELHWRWQRNPWLMRFDPARVWGGARPLPFFAQEIATPGAEELFIFLCVHGSRHLWTRLKWLVDIAWWMKDPARAATVAGALQRAKQLGAVHSLENAAELLERLSGMPQAWLPNEQRGRAAQTVADQVLTRWGQPRRPATGLDELSRKVWVEWILSDGWASRLRGIVWGRFVRPNDNDMETLLLPPALTPLYFPLKPILWLSRRFGAGSHGGTE